MNAVNEQQAGLPRRGLRGSLAIRIENIEGALEVNFTAPDGEEIRQKCNMTQVELAKRRKKLLYWINENRKNLRSRDIQKLARAIAELHDKGNTLIGRLFPDCYEVQQFFNRCYRDWHDPAATPLQVEMEAETHDAVPFELLPVFCTEIMRRSFDDFSDLTYWARSFPGLSTIFTRMLPPKWRSPPEPVLDAGAKLQMKFFRDDRLDAAAKEFGFLQKRGDLKVDGPWPTRKVRMDNFVKDVLHHLASSDESFSGAVLIPPSQIYHFACHCDTLSDDEDEHFITFGTKDTRFLLGINEMYRDRTRRPLSKVMPLIFLNACSSAGGDLLGAASFPRVFLHNNSHGFIGTEVAILDDSARLFSEEFYSQFLTGSQPLGNAIYKAKQTLLDSNNLLGLFYTVYGNPDLSVQRRQATDATNDVSDCGSRSRPE